MLRRKETGTNGKYDMIDLIITSLIEHEKVLSELSYRFEEVVFLLEKVLHEKGGD